jgi:hypothetical protein
MKCGAVRRKSVAGNDQKNIDLYTHSDLQENFKSRFP